MIQKVQGQKGWNTKRYDTSITENPNIQDSKTVMHER